MIVREMELRGLIAHWRRQDGGARFAASLEALLTLAKKRHGAWNKQGTRVRDASGRFAPPRAARL